MDSIAQIAVELQSLGLANRPGLLSRRGGAGPAEGGALILGGRVLNVPFSSPFAARSPFSLRQDSGGLTLFRHEKPLTAVQAVARPRFYDLASEDGRPLWKIALLHGRDCLASTVLQHCAFWPQGRACLFCGIELSLQNGLTLAKKSPTQLAEAARAASHLDGVRQVVLTSGATARPGGEAGHLAACCRAIKQASGLAVHVQLMPPEEPGPLEELKDAGADTVGLHIESLDQAVLARVAPAKAALGLQAYLNAWRWAVEIFGPGQVSSFLIAGLGEDPQTLRQGVRLLSDMGVYPFLLPLRPIPGSPLAEVEPPPPDLMSRLYQDTARILSEAGLHSADHAAGCVHCGACSALGFFDQPPARLVCHPARTEAELEAALAIRHQVFIVEQGMFPHSDRDQNDARSIHLVARAGDQVVGTVRVFPNGDGGHTWVGGRLAVEAQRRDSGAGEMLVRRAVATVKDQGCRRFIAYIQEKNVAFFRRLGWREQGPGQQICGRPHQMMEADLGDDKGGRP